MRLGFSVAAFVIAVAALVMTLLNQQAARKASLDDKTARLMSEITRLKRQVGDLSSWLDEVSAELADMRASAAPQHPQQPPQKPHPQTSPPQTSATNPPPISQATSPDESLRKIVREEIRKYYEERHKQHMPQDWERKEFGNLAYLIHHIGEKLGLSAQQKRAYFQIIKRFNKQVQELWSRIKAEMGNASYREKARRFGEERKRLLEQAREEVDALLTPQQRAKHHQLMKKDSLLRYYP